MVGVFCISQDAPNRTNRINACVYVNVCMCLKELTYTILEAARFEICRAGWQARNSGKS